ncbi:MAG: ATP synthase F1 subunit epsilon [Actinomycetota bacterium]|nr:ATP synthase F1 subunit epsilon [Actinomycetota bacterium]
MATTEVEVVSPDRILYSGEAEMVVCRTVDGEIAFLAEHTPLIGAMVPCVLRIVAESGDEDVFAVGGGFVDVGNNKVIVLADQAQEAGDIDVATARSDLEAAQNRQGSDDEDNERAATAERWAEVRLEVAGESADTSRP